MGRALDQGGRAAIHEPDSFHLDMATYLGADPDVVARAMLDEVARLAAVRDGGAPAAALAQAEGLVVACLAFLQTAVGHEDLADALTRAAAGAAVAPRWRPRCCDRPKGVPPDERLRPAARARRGPRAAAPRS